MEEKHGSDVGMIAGATLDMSSTLNGQGVMTSTETKVSTVQESTLSCIQFTTSSMAKHCYVSQGNAQTVLVEKEDVTGTFLAQGSFSKHDIEAVTPETMLNASLTEQDSVGFSQRYNKTAVTTGPLTTLSPDPVVYPPGTQFIFARKRRTTDLILYFTLFILD